jgi:hypothetical protein
LAEIRRAALLLLVGLSACAGVFQRAMPAQPDEYARSTPADDLRVGAAERDITPLVGGYLAGFSLARVSTGIASRLKVRVLVLLAGDRRVAILGLDDLGVMREDVDWIKSGLPGFANGDVFVCSSHTHAGPDLIGLWGYYFMSSGRDRGYVALLRRACREAVTEAIDKAAPATLRLGEAQLPAEGMVGNSKRLLSFDRRVVVLQAIGRDTGAPLGTLLQLGCHPEVMPRTNTLLSADYVGELCDAWQRAGHGQAVFVNGALGAMVTPRAHSRDIDGARKMGGELCALAEAALAGASPLPVTSIEVRRRDVYLPLGTIGLTLGRLTSVVERELYDGCARSSVGWLRLGDFEAMAVPGEMEPALAARIRMDLGKPNLVVFGLCDDELGYLLREVDANDPLFRYERSMSPCRLAGEMVASALTGR